MATITIRNLDDDVKKRLRIRAAENGRSMEDEARTILKGGLDPAEGSPRKSKPQQTGADLFAAIHARFAPLGGVELNIPPRGPRREAPFQKPKRRR